MKALKFGIFVLLLGVFSFSCHGNRPKRDGLVKKGQYAVPHKKTPKMDTGGATKPGSDQRQEDSSAYKPVGGK